jgi:prolyl 4-hydroxylase
MSELLNIENSSYQKNILSQEPLVYTISDFIDDETCDHFIQKAKPSLATALVALEKNGSTSSGRTNSNCWIAHNSDAITMSVANKIAEVVGLPLQNAESFQIVHYDTEQRYNAHFDAFVKDDADKNKRLLKRGGQRMITALVYLNDVEEGGHTSFTKLNINVAPEKKKLLVFHNCYEGTTKRHENSLHAGTPPTKGEKYAFNLWFREQNFHSVYEYNAEDFKE